MTKISIWELLKEVIPAYMHMGNIFNNKYCHLYSDSYYQEPCGYIWYNVDKQIISFHYSNGVVAIKFDLNVSDPSEWTKGFKLLKWS